MTDQPAIRLPIHRAPFYFAPDFIPTREKWIKTFSALLATACKNAGRSVDVVAGDGYQVKANIGLLRFTIDGEEGFFDVEEVLDDGDWSAMPDFFVSAMPAVFRDELAVQKAPNRLREDKKIVAAICEWLIRSMNARFDSAISKGHAHYFCRKTELGDLVKLDADQLALFDVDERHSEADELDTATARFSGTKLYCVCVVPTNFVEVSATASASKPKNRLVRGRPPTVDHQLLDSVMLELMQSNKGAPDRSKSNWTNAIYAEAVIRRMAERGATVGKTTVIDKIRPLIQQVKKARPAQDLRKIRISEIH